MNTTCSDSVDLISEINSLVGQQTQVQVCICPPFTSLQKSSNLVEQTEVLLGAQNMSAEPSGAYTGEISAEMLRDLYVNFVILGHSERRQYFGETNTTIPKPYSRHNLKKSSPSSRGRSTISILLTPDLIAFLQKVSYPMLYMGLK